MRHRFLPSHLPAQSMAERERERRREEERERERERDTHTQFQYCMYSKRVLCKAL